MEKLSKKVEFVCSSVDYSFLKKACLYFGTTIPEFMRVLIQQLRSADWASLIDEHES